MGIQIPVIHRWIGDYELMAYSSTKIDYEYIINLIQNIVTPTEEDEEITPQERQKKLEEVKTVRGGASQR